MEGRENDDAPAGAQDAEEGCDELGPGMDEERDALALE
jgi:hypothetical protein